MSVENSLCTDNDDLVQQTITGLQGEYTALLRFIVGKDWAQCRETIKRCRVAYSELFDFPVESLGQYADDVKKLQLINNQTLELLDHMRKKRSEELKEMRRARKVKQHYSENRAG